jgi:hypothetical protein
MSAAPNLSDTLTRGYAADKARRALASYRGLLGIILILEGAVGVAMLVAPVGVARLLGYPASEGSTVARFAGLLLLLVVALLLPGRGWPVRAKILSITGVAGRALLGLALLFLGRGLMFVGLFELLASAALGWLYYRLFAAEVMNRP